MSSEQYAEQILSEQLPQVLEQGLVRSADVFCEPGWFSVEQSEDILKASRHGGLDLRMHIDEFVDGGGGELAAELRVDTADHAFHTSGDTRQNMESVDVNTGFLPGTPYAMGTGWPDFNDAIEDEITWSVATDFNPNCKINQHAFHGFTFGAQDAQSIHWQHLLPLQRNPSETTPHPTGISPWAIGGWRSCQFQYP